MSEQLLINRKSIYRFGIHPVVVEEAFEYQCLVMEVL